MNIIEKVEKEQIEKLQSDKKIPDFNAGDTVYNTKRFLTGMWRVLLV